jgi:small subunit ribosomal protein S2
VREARRLGLPILALVDTNCDPDEADYVIPGNDDAIRSCSLIVRAIADGIAAGQSKVTEREFESDGNGGPPEAAEPAVAAEAPAEPEAPTMTAPELEQLSPGESTVEATAPSEVTGEAAAAEPAVIAEETAETADMAEPTETAETPTEEPTTTDEGATQ